MFFFSNTRLRISLQHRVVAIYRFVKKRNLRTIVRRSALRGLVYYRYRVRSHVSQCGIEQITSCAQSLPDLRARSRVCNSGLRRIEIPSANFEGTTFYVANISTAAKLQPCEYTIYC